MPILEAQVTNPQQALLYTSLLRQLRGPNPQQNIEAIVAADLGPVVISSFNPGSAQNLAWWYGGTASRKIFLIDGIKNLQQASAVITNYSSAGLTIAPATVNNYFHQQASLIGGTIGWETLVRQEHVDLVGHSAGGATALALAQFFLNYEFRPKLKISTFGAPRTGIAAWRDRVAGLSIARWMNSADPIPLIPLRLEDAPQIALIVPITQLQNWSSYVHTQGGININDNGTTSPNTLPLTAAARPINSIVNWYFGIADDPSNAHSLVTYTNNLQRVVNAEQIPATVEVDDAPREHSTAVDRRQINQARNASAVAVFEQAAAQTSNPITTPEATLFKAFRSGRVWYVGLGESTVMTAGPEKRARHIARAGNDFLRSLQKQAVVDPETLLDQVRIFLELAQDPSTGFRPTINTTPPG